MKEREEKIESLKNDVEKKESTISETQGSLDLAQTELDSLKETSTDSATKIAETLAIKESLQNEVDALKKSIEEKGEESESHIN